MIMRLVVIIITVCVIVIVIVIVNAIIVVIVSTNNKTIDHINYQNDYSISQFNYHLTNTHSTD